MSFNQQKLGLTPTCPTSWLDQIVFTGDGVISGFHFKRGSVGGSPAWLRFVDLLILSQHQDERPTPGLAYSIIIPINYLFIIYSNILLQRKILPLVVSFCTTLFSLDFLCKPTKFAYVLSNMV